MKMARGVRFPPAMAMMRETTLSMFPEKNAFVQRTYLNLVKHKHKSQPDNVHINNAEKLKKKESHSRIYRNSDLNIMVTLLHVDSFAY
jgi:hypothetical protein